jgi:hypothetical protein
MKIIGIIISTMLLFFILGCKEDPIGGIYEMKDRNKYAFVYDSTFYFMCGFDSAFIYDLRFHKLFEYDNVIVRFYNIQYSNSLNRRGYGYIDCPLHFVMNEKHGGLPLVIFGDNDSISFGGYFFIKAKDPEHIFNAWVDLTTKNLDTKLWEYSQQ